MKRVHRVMSDPLLVPVLTRIAQPIEASAEVGQAAPPVLEVVVYSPGPVPCRCGRYLSEDFDGRLFCRGCERIDRADITSRLPLRYRPL
jgi:hypothetical protein